MKITRQVVVFDAPDLDAESTFWAALLGGTVETEEAWHTIRVEGEEVLGIQLAPGHVPPHWPDGEPQQLHLDLMIEEDLASAHAEAMSLGARLLQAAPHPEAPRGFQVYADPAGHPFCLCWGG